MAAYADSTLETHTKLIHHKVCGHGNKFYQWVEIDRE